MTEQKKDDTIVKVFGGAILGAVLVMLSNNSELNSRYSLTDDEVIAIIEQTNKSFDLAEQQILKEQPDPDDTPSGPDPDPKKCICGGTGKITHGDGHQTDCPYHGRGTERPSLSEEEVRATKEYVPRRRIFNLFRGKVFN